MKKLISLSEFIDNLDYEAFAEDEMNRLCIYHQFLKEPLKLEMFIVCDENGVPMNKPEENNLNNSFYKMVRDYNYAKMYEERKEKVIFENFQIIGIDNKIKEYEIELIDNDYWLTFYNNAVHFAEEVELKQVSDLLGVNGAELIFTKSAIEKFNFFKPQDKE